MPGGEGVGGGPDVFTLLHKCLYKISTAGGRGRCNVWALTVHFIAFFRMVIYECVDDRLHVSCSLE